MGRKYTKRRKKAKEKEREPERVKDSRGFKSLPHWLTPAGQGLKDACWLQYGTFIRTTK